MDESTQITRRLTQVSGRHSCGAWNRPARIKEKLPKLSVLAVRFIKLLCFDHPCHLPNISEKPNSSELWRHQCRVFYAITSLLKQHSVCVICPHQTTWIPVIVCVSINDSLKGIDLIGSFTQFCICYKVIKVTLTSVQSIYFFFKIKWWVLFFFSVFTIFLASGAWKVFF